jgi:endothelin-converting enzyme/putative endopeptidase
MLHLRFASAAIFLGILSTFALAVSHAQSSSPSGLDLSAIDKSVNPCDDFYQYACGTWLKDNPIPPDESSWGRFNVLHENNEKILRGILEDSAAHTDRSPIDQKIGAFYQSCMDEATLNRLGKQPLQPDLDRIEKITSRTELLAEVVSLQKQQTQVLFNFGSTPDPTNATDTIADLDQGGLGLPEKDFYLRTDPHSVELRKQYVAHIGKMFQLLGLAPADADKQANAVMSLETDLAKVSLDVTSRRDPKNVVHKMSMKELAVLSPDFNFSAYFSDMGAPPFQTLNVDVPTFIKGLSQLLESRPIRDWKDYLRWHLIHSNAIYLSDTFLTENFNFYGRILSGTPEMRPRWKRCVNVVDDELGEALGKKYVDKTFGEQGKARTLELVHEIEAEMSKDIESLKWMSPQTKAEAQIKLRAVTNKIGYPDKWRDYSSVKVIPDDYFGDILRANQFEVHRELSKINKPVDRSEWGMTPPTVNAYYDPSENNINFPAGILQAPFYSNSAGDPANYGAIGAVIGHELTHGFDDEGRQFDAEGNLKDWWSKQDEEAFKKLADCFVNEYGSFSPTPGIELNGRLTLGENTADNGGIHLAYAALLDVHNKKGVSLTALVDGYTPQQQFFIGFAQVWCNNERPEEARVLAQTDPHSPGRFRANGVVSNMPEFSQAFSCKSTDKMFAVRACRVW